MIIYNCFSKLGRDFGGSAVFLLAGRGVLDTGRAYWRSGRESAVAECKNDFIEELKAMKERMDELFQRNFTDEGQYSTDREEDWMPAVDIIDAGRDLVYVLDLPGVMDEDLQVECKDNRLWISGRKGEWIPDGTQVHIERPRGSFSRIFRFPCPVVETGIEAEFKKGVLRITVPKSSTNCRTQKIAVREVD
jgi:HSP20 family protein